MILATIIKTIIIMVGSWIFGFVAGQAVERENKKGEEK